MECSYLELLLFTLILCFKGLCCFSNMFIYEPYDVCISEGSNALFRCTLAGATATPFWKINGQIYSSTRLPLKHVYNGAGLIVQNADLYMNNSTYSCLYSVTTSEGSMLQDSRTALLTVRSSNEACLIIRTTTMNFFVSNSVVSVTSMPQVSFHLIGTSKLMSLSMVITMLSPSKTPSMKQVSQTIQVLKIIYLSSAGLVSSITVIASGIILLLCIKLKRKGHCHSINTEPIYEEIELRDIHDASKTLPI